MQQKSQSFHSEAKETRDQTYESKSSDCYTSMEPIDKEGVQKTKATVVRFICIFQCLKQIVIMSGLRILQYKEISFNCNLLRSKRRQVAHPINVPYVCHYWHYFGGCVYGL